MHHGRSKLIRKQGSALRPSSLETRSGVGVCQSAEFFSIFRGSNWKPTGRKRMRRSPVLSKLGVLCLLILLSAPLFAQETTGGLQGTIKDPSGAVVPGATIDVAGPALIGKKT